MWHCFKNGSVIKCHGSEVYTQEKEINSCPCLGMKGMLGLNCLFVQGFMKWDEMNSDFTKNLMSAGGLHHLTILWN